MIDALEVRRVDEGEHFAEATAGRRLLPGGIGRETGEADHDEEEDVAIRHGASGSVNSADHGCCGLEGTGVLKTKALGDDGHAFG